MRPTPGALSLLAIVCAGAVASGVWLYGLHVDCHNHWRDSGLRSDYRDGACMVEAAGRWYPAGSVKIHVRGPG